MSAQIKLRKDILNYISNSPLAWEYPPADLANMTVEDLLHLVDGAIDNRESRAEEHSYEIIEIDSFPTAKQYEHYAPTWCIFHSEEIYYEETHQGRCHFVFCKRDDADNYDRLAFGPDYPYDNYGMSFIAILLTSGNRLVSITSRRNWDGDFDYHLSCEQLRNALGGLVNSTVSGRFSVRLQPRSSGRDF